MPTIRTMIVLSLLAGVLSCHADEQLVAPKGAPQMLLKWDDIESGRYTLISIVRERENEPLSSVIPAAKGSIAEVTVKEDTLELRLEGGDKPIQLPRSHRDDAGDGRRPYTGAKTSMHLMRATGDKSSQQLTFWVVYRGHFVLERAADVDSKE